jgi:hypothetical protein
VTGIAGGISGEVVVGVAIDAVVAIAGIEAILDDVRRGDSDSGGI